MSKALQWPVTVRRMIEENGQGDLPNLIYIAEAAGFRGRGLSEADAIADVRTVLWEHLRDAE